MHIRLTMDSEDKRIESFANFPFVNGRVLAKVGLYFYPFSKCVKCCDCSFNFDNLNYNIDLVFVHAFNHMNCTFVINSEHYIWQPLDMSDVDNRLRTLTCFSIAFDKKKIASCGFYYTGDGSDDWLECHVCNKTFGDWQQGEALEDAHKKLYPYCSENNKMPNLTISYNRKNTFLPEFNSSSIDKMVDSGLYYTGNRQCKIVKCFACHYYFNLPDDWSSIDMDAIHKNANPNCLYMQWKFRKIVFTDSKPRLDSDMLDVHERLETLKSWPIFFVNKNDVANAGFFYNGSGYDDVLECSSCDVTYKGIKIGEDPFTIHKKLNAECFFVKNISEKISTKYTPIRPKYGSFKVRMDTFQDWPLAHIQDPRLLAKSGLAYTKEGDLVFCYYCNSIMSEWLPDEDPWIKHALSNPTCFFLTITKGEEFSKVAKQNNQTNKTNNMKVDSASIDLSADDTCKICFSSRICTVFLECGHSAACVKCACSLSTCPYCRADIKRVIVINYNSFKK